MRSVADQDAARQPPRAAARRPLHWLAALAAAWLLLFAPFAQAERIVVKEAVLAAPAEGAEPGVYLDAIFDFDLPFTLEDAVNRGVPLYFVVELEVTRYRWYWFDARVAAPTLTYRLSYSPLTRQYRLARGTLALPFESLGEALSALRRVRNWRAIEPGILRPDESYRAQVRLRLDTAQLPRPFQVNALTSRDWALASDWQALAVPPEVLR